MCDFEGDLKDLGPVPDALLEPVDRRLAGADEVWARADAEKPNKFAVFRDGAQHIVLQYPDHLSSHRRSHYTPDWEGWAPLVAPLVAHATKAYGYPGGRTARIMLARLSAGGVIARHVDASASALVPHKIHVPLVTDARVAFEIGEGVYHLERGRAYEVNNRRPHAVRNESAIDRVHLIFDYFYEA